MNIRLADRTDADELVEFNQAMAQETEGKRLDPATLSAGVFAVFEDSNKGFYVVASEDGRIVGGLLVTFEWSDWRNGWFWWIQSVFIRPEYRGRSIYTDLYDFVRLMARNRGNVCGFRLYVEKENKHAQRVYEKLGMEVTYYLMYEEKNKAGISWLNSRPVNYENRNQKLKKKDCEIVVEKCSPYKVRN